MAAESSVELIDPASTATTTIDGPSLFAELANKIALGVSFARWLEAVFSYLEAHPDLLRQVRNNKAVRQQLKQLVLRGLDVLVKPGRENLNYRNWVIRVFEVDDDSDKLIGWLSSVVLQLMIIAQDDPELKGPEKHRLVKLCTTGLLSSLRNSDDQLEDLVEQLISGFISARTLLAKATAPKTAGGCCGLF